MQTNRSQTQTHTGVLEMFGLMPNSGTSEMGKLLLFLLTCNLSTVLVFHQLPIFHAQLPQPKQLPEFVATPVLHHFWHPFNLFFESEIEFPTEQFDNLEKTSVGAKYQFPLFGLF